MKAKIKVGDKSHVVWLNKGKDISIALSAGEDRVRAWYVDPIRIEPVRSEAFTGSVDEGGSVNFRDIYFNPHGHGTHTECVGHIDKTVHSVNQGLKDYFHLTALMSVKPKELAFDRSWMKAGDMVIGPEFLQQFPSHLKPTALVIRTLPNTEDKVHRNYSASNPPYLLPETMEKIVDLGIEHLLIDLPSVDREMDEGRLSCHHIFWEHPENTRFDKTITEFIYAPEELKDGLYLMNLQVAPFENDASPSRPVLFEIIPDEEG